MVLQTHAMVAAMAFHAVGNAFLLHKALFPLLEEDSSAMVSTLWDRCTISPP
jgi:hypothetical protein